MNARFLAGFFAAVALLGSLPFWWWLQKQDVVPATAAATTQVQDTTSEPTPEVRETITSSPAAEGAPIVTPESVRPEKPQPELVTGPDPGRSPLADRLNAADGSIDLDLAILHKVLGNYLLELGANPVGSNREITAQLSGRNPRHHAPLPHDLPAIDAGGELLDRWGTPFFFHALSSREMDIRSAGPDRELYTADDALWSPTR